jgi:hypothetical protein
MLLAGGWGPHGNSGVGVSPPGTTDFNRSTTLVVGQFEIRPSRRMDSMARKEQPCGLGALP